MKLQFENFWGDFPVRDNIVTVALSMRHDVQIVNGNADVVIHNGPKVQKRNNAITIAWFIESMNRIGEPDYSKYDYSFNSCNFEDDRNYRIPFWSTQMNWNNAPSHDMNRGPTYLVSLDKLYNRNISTRDRLCSSVASGTLGKRAEFYPKISQYIGVTHGGDFLRNTSETIAKPPPGVTRTRVYSDYLEKINFISKFKSNLCFENDDRDGYVCEKILHAFYAGCLPIYWGPKNVGEDFNKDAFIDVGDFTSDEEAIEYIQEVLSDDAKLLSYLQQPVFNGNKIPDHATPEALSLFFESIGV